MENKNLAPPEPVVREGDPTPSNATAEPAAAFTRGPLTYGHTGMDDPNSGPPWWEVYTPHAGATAYVWREADAKLYAAAPEMPEAITDLLGIIASVCPEYLESTMCANARAIHAKATGADQ